MRRTARNIVDYRVGKLGSCVKSCWKLFRVLLKFKYCAWLNRAHVSAAPKLSIAHIQRCSWFSTVQEGLLDEMSRPLSYCA